MTDAELIEAFGKYQMSRSFAATTIYRRRMAIRRFGAFMAPGSITAATVMDIEEWLVKLKSARTKHAYSSDLTCFFRWAFKRGLVDHDPAVDLGSVRVPKGKPKPAPIEAISRAFSMADADTQLMLMLGALAGLRRAEIGALATVDVYLDRQPPILIVREGKGMKDRIVPLHPLLVELLRTRRTGWVFAHPRKGGEHLDADAVGRRLAKALSYGEMRITGHQLRHYFGTEAARWSNGNVILVGQLMGHEDPSTSMGYIGWDPVEGAEVVAKIEGGRPNDELRARRDQRSA